MPYFFFFFFGIGLGNQLSLRVGGRRSRETCPRRSWPFEKFLCHGLSFQLSFTHFPCWVTMSFKRVSQQSLDWLGPLDSSGGRWGNHLLEFSFPTIEANSPDCLKGCLSECRSLKV